MLSFGDDPAAATVWAKTAVPRDYAAHAPRVFARAAAGDEVAARLLRAAAAEVDTFVARLVELGASRVTLMGGLAVPYRPWLSAATCAHLVEAAGDALDGAIRLARQGGVGGT